MKLLYVTADGSGSAQGGLSDDGRSPEDRSVDQAEDLETATSALAERDYDCVIVDGDRETDAGTTIDTLRATAPSVPVVWVGTAADEATLDSLYDRENTAFVAENGAASGRVVTERARSLADERLRSHHAAAVSAIAERVAAVTVDDGGRIRTATGSVGSVFGRDREAMVGTTLAELVGQSDADRLRSTDGLTGSVDVLASHPDGSEQPATVTGVVVRDDGRTVLFEDRQVSRYREELDSVMDRVTDAFFGLDEEWRFTYLNDRAERLLERPSEDLVGENVWDEFGDALGTAFQREYEHAMAEQEPVEFREYFPPLETWFEVRAYPSETGLSVYFRDVTRQKQIDDQGRVLEAIVRALAETTDLAAGLEPVVDSVVTETDWSYGEAWTVDDGEPIPTDTWAHDPVSTVAEATDLSEIREGLASGGAATDLLTRALQRGETVRASLESAGLETVVATPVVRDGEPVAVLLFGLHVAREEVERLIGAVEAAAAELSELALRIEERAERRRKERRFEAVFDDPASFIALVSPDGVCELANERAQELASEYGFDFEGAYYWEHPHWAAADVDRTTVREYVERAASGEYVQFESRNESGERPLVVDTTMRPVYDDEGAVEHVLIESRDVTDRYLAERERRRRERHFDALFEDPDSLVMQVDDDGEVTRVNDTALSFTPRTREEVTGDTFWELSWWTETDIGDETMRERTMRALSGEYVRFESINDERYGETVALDVQLRPVFDGDGEVDFVLMDAKNITERYRLERRLREERNLNTRILEVSPFGIAVTHADGTVAFSNSRADELFGGMPENVFEADALLDQAGDPVDPASSLTSRVIETGEAVYGEEFGIERDDDVRWVSVSAVPLEDGRAVIAFEDVTGQRERAKYLSELAEAMQSFPDLETKYEVARAAVETAHDTLGVEPAAIALYDDDEGRLELAEGSDEELRPAVSGPPRDSVAWQAFVGGEVERDETALAIPAGDHGVFLCAPGSTEDETRRRLVDLLVATVAAELGRADREAALRSQADVLESRRTELERVNQVNRIIRTLTGELVQATTREEVIEAACDCFADEEPFVMAWFGRYDPTEGRITPAERAGEGADYVEEVVVTTDDDDNTGEGPAGRAFRTHEVQLQNDLYRDEAFEPWRKAALRRGFRASVAVPVVHRDSFYGVLNLYADEPNVFGDLEREVLAELGDTIGYAINALERKQALLADRSIELELGVDVRDVALYGDLPDGGFEFEHVVHREDGRVDVFFTVPADAREALEDDQPAAVQQVNILSAGDHRLRCEMLLSEDSLTARLFDRGFVLRDARLQEGELVLTVRIPTDADTRDVVEMYETAGHRVDLKRKHEVTEPVRSARAFEDAYLSDLTERQEEVLRTAYSAGFFEWPRVSSGQDVADLLGVSQPTVNRHVRTAERKLFDRLFAGDQ